MQQEVLDFRNHYYSDRFASLQPKNLVEQEKASIVRLAEAVLSETIMQTTLTSSRDAQQFLRMKLANNEHEVFVVLYLDNQHRLIALEELFRGTIDGAAVYPREVVKQALAHNASALIFAHNHPSGIPEPSQADIAITRKLRMALDTVDMRTLDHVVVAKEGVVSLAERGLL